MKILLFICALALLLHLGIAPGSSNMPQTKPRTPRSRYNRILQTSGDVTLPANSANIGNLFTLYFEFEPAGYLTMVIKFKIPNQYFSIGFGNRMTGADIWLFQIVNSEIVVSDRIGVGYTAPALDTSLGGTDDLQRLGYEITSSYSLVKIRRALNTGDSNDAVISQGLVNMIYATGTSPIMNVKHTNSGRGSVVVPLATGTSGATVEDTSIQGRSNVENAHAIVSIIAWGAIADLSIIFVRLMKGKKLTLGKNVIPAQVIHSLMMWIAIIMSVVVTGLILNQNRKDRGSELLEVGDRDFHYINGLIVLALMLLVIFSGGLTMSVLRPYNKISNSIMTAKMIHRVLGALIYLLAKANIITGVLFHDEGTWKVGVFIYLGLLLLAHLLIQLLIWHKSKNSNQSPLPVSKPVLSPLQRALVEEINKGISRNELIKNFFQIKWVILENKVYDLTDWLHPGGNFLIEACVGREVGRYFYGNYALEGTKIKPHKHSAATVSQLSNFYIGEVTSHESILSNKGTKNAVSRASDQWKIVRITPITDNVSEISFQNPDFSIKSFGNSLSWLGRHFRLSFDRENSLARQYSIALSITPSNTQLRENICRYFNEIMEGNPAAPFSQDQSSPDTQDSLSLFVKNYKSFQGLSSLIHQTDINSSSNKFRIEGPTGRGLELSVDSTGTHCIICSGTGILPFIDFMNLFLWKTMYQLIKEKAGAAKAQQINMFEIPFDRVLNGMSVKFIGAFSNSKEVLGLDIIKKLAEINKKYKTNNFVAMMKGYSDENIVGLKEDFSSEEFLKRNLTLKEEKIYVVGPPKFNEDVPKALMKLGIANQGIILA